MSRLVLSDVYRRIGATVLSFGSLVDSITIVYIVLGIGIGIIGSILSMRRYLDV